MEFKLENLLTEEEYLELDNRGDLVTVEEVLLAFLKLGFRRTAAIDDAVTLVWKDKPSWINPNEVEFDGQL